MGELHAVRWELAPQTGARTREPIYTAYHATKNGTWTYCGRLIRMDFPEVDQPEKVDCKQCMARKAWKEQASALVEAIAEARTGPIIVCLCGSTRFYKDFLEQNYLETMAGKIVLSVGFYPHATAEMHGEGVGITPEQKEALDQLHLRKVEMADEVLVLNRDGYIGSSTARELAHARTLGKVVRFLDPVEGTQ